MVWSRLCGAANRHRRLVQERQQRPLRQAAAAAARGPGPEPSAARCPRLALAPSGDRHASPLRLGRRAHDRVEVIVHAPGGSPPRPQAPPLGPSPRRGQRARCGLGPRAPVGPGERSPPEMGPGELESHPGECGQLGGHWHVHAGDRGRARRYEDEPWRGLGKGENA